MDCSSCLASLTSAYRWIRKLIVVCLRRDDSLIANLALFSDGEMIWPFIFFPGGSMVRLVASLREGRGARRNNFRHSSLVCMQDTGHASYELIKCVKNHKFVIAAQISLYLEGGWFANLWSLKERCASYLSLGYHGNITSSWQDFSCFLTSECRLSNLNQKPWGWYHRLGTFHRNCMVLW